MCKHLLLKVRNKFILRIDKNGDLHSSILDLNKLISEDFIISNGVLSFLVRG